MTIWISCFLIHSLVLDPIRIQILKSIVIFSFIFAIRLSPSACFAAWSDVLPEGSLKRVEVSVSSIFSLLFSSLKPLKITWQSRSHLNYRGKPCCCDNGDEEQREEGDSAEEVGVQKCCEAHDPAYRYCEQKLLCTVLSKDMEWYTQHYWQARPALEHVKAPETRDDSETSCLANLERLKDSARQGKARILRGSW